MRWFRRKKQVSELARLLVALDALAAERGPTPRPRRRPVRVSLGR